MSLLCINDSYKMMLLVVILSGKINVVYKLIS